MSVFEYCSSLTSVTLGNSLNYIGHMAFYKCTGLKSVTIPNPVEVIGPTAFGGCINLTSVTIPSSVNIIGTNAFEGCKSLTSVTLPNSVTEIMANIFRDCSGLVSVNLGNSVSSIGPAAFYGCSSLSSITIPGTVNAIGNQAFFNCRNLVKIYYGAEEPFAASEDVFSDYSKPTLYVKESAMDKIKTTVPWSLFEKVETYNFNGEPYTLTYSYNGSNSTATVVGFSAESLVGVIIPESTEKDGTQYTVTGIDASTFAGNSLLRTVTIPSTVNDIDPGAFKGCANLETVNYFPVSVNTTNDHHANPIFSDCPKFKNLNIGENVKEISKFIFKCTDIETVVIPDNVEALRNDCFADCYYLSDITIGRGVSTIDCAAFAFGSSSDLYTKVYCNAREITYYRGLGGSTSSYMPFNKRRVSSIEFGPDVERLDDYAFSDVNPGDIYCNATTPPVVANGNVLKSVNKSTCTLHVPAESLQLYQTAYFWKDFYNIRGDISGIEDVVVEDNAPMEVYNLSGLKVGDSLEGLAPGLYIVRQGLNTKKVMVQ